MIYISAGHYPHAPGAKYAPLSFVEYDEAIIWRNKLVEMLGSHQATKVPTGPLRTKVDYINSGLASMAVEIHFNDFLQTMPDGRRVQRGNGSETLYFPTSANGLMLATMIQSELGKVFSPDRGAKAGWYRMDKNNGPDFFLARTRCTSVIVEPDFVVNAKKIRDNRDAGCEAIAIALQKFLTRIS